MADKKKLGFGGQWIDLFKTGRHVGIDDKGKKTAVDVAPEFLQAVSDNYDSALHEAPACIGHPENDAPAYGWVASMRVDGEMLQAQFADTDPGFEQIVNEGRYKKRSPKFYLDEQGCGKSPYLRHVAWLGAQPPAVKGMRDVQRHAQFSEDEGNTVAFEIEFSEGEQPVTEQKKPEKPIGEQISEYFRNLFKKEEPATASFSEADRTKLIADATAAASAAFSEELKKRDNKIAELTTQVQSQVGGSKRAELVSFCEGLERKGILPPSFRRMGGVEFLEALAGLPAEKKITTIEFAEEGTGENKKVVEKKKEVSTLQFAEAFLSSLPPYIQFGEQFGDVKLKGDGSDITNPQRQDQMRAEVGLKTSKESK